MDDPLIEARVFNDGMLLAITDTFIVMMFLTAIIFYANHFYNHVLRIV